MLVVVFQLYGATFGDVIPFDGVRGGADISSVKQVVTGHGSSDPTIDSAKILGSYESGDLTVLLHNTQKDLGPEFYKFTLQPQWVREPEVAAPTTQTTTSRP